MAWVKSKDAFIKLLMLYNAWMPNERHVGGPVERKNQWRDGVQWLAEEAEKRYGNIRIAHMAKAVVANTKW